MHTVLIANRGEIAVRIARACRDTGLSSVAVYSEPDRSAPHVRACDEAYALGGAAPAETYLDIDKLIAVARRSGADAVHPGYGFLSESPEFAQAVTDAGLVWIGPPPEVIRVLGDKVQARELVRRVGAPVAPGGTEPLESAEDVLAFGETHGWPVVIKAVHGGGGRGMRVVRTPEEAGRALEAAAREARTAFGLDECFVERYVDRARHVETQCLADQYGNVVVVSTRDCTVQRRHQKLLEEAPAPFLSEDVVGDLYEASKTILHAVGYVGAGTCEFLVGEDGTISFLEVNTRIQVEHPVSEEVTGIDLVAEMMRVAQGGKLGYGDPEVRGHSIEFRINAEDAGRDFLPSPGTITAFVLPNGPGVRVDTGCAAGFTVPREYDSMVAKLVVTGATRDEAIRRARRALEEFEVGGMPTVIPFHRALLDDPSFAPTDPEHPFQIHTGWLESEFVNAVPPHDGEAVSVAPLKQEQFTVEVDGRRVEIALDAAAVGPLRGGAARRRPPRWSPTTAPRAVGGGTGALASLMQGTVVEVLVGEGQQVEVGQTVVTLEAMKMEHAVVAHRSGTVRGLALEAGQVITSGAFICDIDETQETEPCPGPEPDDVREKESTQ